MASYKVEVLPSARKALKKLPKKTIIRIKAAIDKLIINPYPTGSVKLSIEEDHYRIRVGDYRVIYFVQHKKLIIQVIKIGHRKNIYKKI